MGTHMWNNNPSRRGRRMSIDLPSLHISPPGGNHGNGTTLSGQTAGANHSSSQSDLGGSPSGHSNADLFFPYLPQHLPNFLNGK